MHIDLNTICEALSTEESEFVILRFMKREPVDVLCERFGITVDQIMAMEACILRKFRLGGAGEERINDTGECCGSRVANAG